MSDCVTAMENLKSDIDIKRAAICGRSSGGYTTLAVLANAPDPDQKLFASGTSYYGISNLVLLAKDIREPLHRKAFRRHV